MSVNMELGSAFEPLDFIYKSQAEIAVQFPNKKMSGIQNVQAGNHLQAAHAITMALDTTDTPNVARPTVNPATQQNQVNRNPLTRVVQAQQAARNLHAQSSVHQPGHRQMQNRLQQQVQHYPAIGTLITDVVDELGAHLAPNELCNLSRVSRHYFNSLDARRQAIVNATHLARGEATILRSGDVVRQNPAVTSPAQFDSALRYIQGLPPEHQREPLQELVRHATTQAQFEAVFDHLQNQGRLQPITMPANFAALPPEGQRAVTIFSWRLSGHVHHNLQGQPLNNPPVPSTPQRRGDLLNAYAILMQGIEGMAFPQKFIDSAQKRGDIRQLLNAFGAPEGLAPNLGYAWLNRESQRGNLRLTPQIYARLPNIYQRNLPDNLPTYVSNMRQASNYVTGMWPLNPTL